MYQFLGGAGELLCISSISLSLLRLTLYDDIRWRWSTDEHGSFTKEP